jgi:hypothetical protein
MRAEGVGRNRRQPYCADRTGKAAQYAIAIAPYGAGHWQEAARC